MIPIWIATLIAVFVLVAGFLAGHEVGLTASRRPVVDVDLTGRHPDPMGLDWQEPAGRVPLALRTSNVTMLRNEWDGRTIAEAHKPPTQPKDAA